MSSDPKQELSSEGLVRGLGRWDATLLTVGGVIGTGIFITTADIARVLPHQGMILLVWALGGVLTLAGALSYAELGALYPRAGGMYHYLKEAYGTFWGFLYGWACFLIIMSGGLAALAVAFGEYLGSFVPFFSTRHVLFSLPIGGWAWSVSGGQLAAALAILLLTAVNYLGLREGAAVQNFLSVFRIGSIVVFVGLAFFTAAPEAVSLTSPVSQTGVLAAIGVAMIAALWTYDGWYGPTFSAGEMRNPQRTLPFGLIWGTVIIMVLYALINIVYLRALPLDEMAETPRVAETVLDFLLRESKQPDWRCGEVAAQFEIRNDDSRKAMVDEANGYSYQDSVRVTTITKALLENVGVKAGKTTYRGRQNTNIC